MEKHFFSSLSTGLKKKKKRKAESSSDLQIESWYFTNTPTLRARR